MTENNARIPINMTEPVDLNLKMESYTIIGDTDAIYNKGYADGEAKGFEEGKNAGLSEGYDVGYAEGLAQRTYETWTMTLADGSTVTKEIALL